MTERSQSKDNRKATLRLLEGFPGAAVLIDSNGKIVGTNRRSEKFVSLFRNGDVREVGSLVEKARSNGSITVGDILVQVDSGIASLQLIIVPDVEKGSFLLLIREEGKKCSDKNTIEISCERYKDLLEVSKDFYWETDISGRFVYVSPQGGIGYQADELININGEKFVVDANVSQLSPFTCQEPLVDIEMQFYSKHGDIVYMMVSCLPVFGNKDGGLLQWSGVRGVCRDVTYQRESETALASVKHREKLLNEIVTAVRHEVEPQSMLRVAASSAMTTFNAAGCRIYRRLESGNFQVAADCGNFEKIDDLDAAITNLKNISDVRSLKLKARHALVATTHYRETVNGAVCIWKAIETNWDEEEFRLIADVASQLGITNEQATNHERMLALSRTDPMTGLLNRRSFLEEELPRRVTRLQHNRQTAALFYVDMDNFKLVNDIHGHQVGDDAIIYLRDMLMDFTRPADVIARLGGDEFAMWLDDISPDVSEARANDLIVASESMEQFSGKPGMPLGISVGVAVYEPDQNESLDELLSRADAAMYRAKRKGKGAFHIARSSSANKKGALFKRRRKMYGV